MEVLLHLEGKEGDLQIIKKIYTCPILLNGFFLLSTNSDLDVPTFLKEKEKLHPLMPGKLMHALSWAADEGSAFL